MVADFTMIASERWKVRIDMKLIIDVPEKVYQNAREDMLSGSELIVNAIKNGTPIEQDPCGDCLFKNEWQKIGKLISVILEKRTDQEQKTEPCEDCISRKSMWRVVSECEKHNSPTWIWREMLSQLPSVQPKTDILDKIRAEIETIEISGMVDANTMYVRSAEQIKNIVIEIIDKYKAESEG